MSQRKRVFFVSDRTGWWMAPPIVLSVISLVMMGPALGDPAAMSNPAALAGMGADWFQKLLNLDDVAVSSLRLQLNSTPRNAVTS